MTTQPSHTETLGALVTKVDWRNCLPGKVINCGPPDHSDLISECPWTLEIKQEAERKLQILEENWAFYHKLRGN